MHFMHRMSVSRWEVCRAAYGDWVPAVLQQHPAMFYRQWKRGVPRARAAPAPQCHSPPPWGRWTERVSAPSRFCMWWGRGMG